MPAETAHTISGTLEPADVVRFHYFHVNRRLYLSTILSFLLIAFGAIGIAVVTWSGDLERLLNPGAFYVIAIFWGLLLLAMPYICARRQYRKQKYLREPMKYDFSDAGIRLEGPSFSSKIVWTLVHAVYETKTSFLIYQGPNLALILPKRFFGDESTIKPWKDFLVKNLPAPNLFHSADIEVGSTAEKATRLSRRMRFVVAVLVSGISTFLLGAWLAVSLIGTSSPTQDSATLRNTKIVGFVGFLLQFPAFWLFPSDQKGLASYRSGGWWRSVIRQSARRLKYLTISTFTFLLLYAAFALLAFSGPA